MLLLMCVLGMQSIMATHIMGGELTYEYRTVTNDYTFMLIVYRDCDGSNLAPTFDIHLQSTTCNIVTSLTLTRDTYDEITPRCSSTVTSCTSGGGQNPIEGVMRGIYTSHTPISLAHCSDWQFWWDSGNRNPDIQNLLLTYNLPSSPIEGIHIAASLDNWNVPDHSSPVFNSAPNIFLCPQSGQQMQSFDLGVHSTNTQDIFSYSWQHCLDKTNPSTAGGISIPYVSNNYSPSSPLGPNWNCNLNANTGHITMTAANPSPITAVYAIKAEQKRLVNGNLITIGSVWRDVEIIFLPLSQCSNTPPIPSTGLFGLPTGIISLSNCLFNISDNSIIKCASGVGGFGLSIFDNASGENVTLSAINNIPGLVFTASAPGNPTYANVDISNVPIGIYYLKVKAQDNHCPYKGISEFTYMIVVKGPTLTLSPPPTAPVCVGTEVQCNLMVSLPCLPLGNVDVFASIPSGLSQTQGPFVNINGQWKASLSAGLFQQQPSGNYAATISAHFMVTSAINPTQTIVFSCAGMGGTTVTANYIVTILPIVNITKTATYDPTTGEVSYHIAVTNSSGIAFPPTPYHLLVEDVLPSLPTGYTWVHTSNNFDYASLDLLTFSQAGVLIPPYTTKDFYIKAVIMSDNPNPITITNCEQNIITCTGGGSLLPETCEYPCPIPAQVCCILTGVVPVPYCHCPATAAHIYNIGTDPNGETNLSTAGLPATLPANSCITVKGRLHIDKDYNIPATTEILMNYQSAIQINPSSNPSNVGIKLSMANTHIHSCGKMWKGIVVGAEGILKMSANTLIEDANTAIEVNTYSILGFGVPHTLDIQRTTFRRNNVAMQLSNTNLAYKIFKFLGNQINCSATTLLYPYPAGTISEAGIKIESSYYPFNIISNGTSKNQFADLRNGILVENASLKINNCMFKNIRNPQNPNIDGFGIKVEEKLLNNMTSLPSSLSLTGLGLSLSTPLTFYNCRYAVQTEKANTTVASCAMDKVDIGVVTTKNKLKDIFIVGNTIKCKDYGIVSFLNEDVHSSVVAQNVIDLNQTSVSPGFLPSGIGIWEANSNQAAIVSNRYINNTVNVTKGIYGMALWGTAGVQVTDNHVNILNLQNVEMGMYFMGATKPLVSCNTVQGVAATSTNTGLTKYAPIALRVEATKDGIYSCNNVNLTKTGIQFNDKCPNTTLQGNSIGAHNAGLHYMSAAVVNSQGIYNPNGSTANGNRWLSTYSGVSVGAVYDGSSASSNAAKYYIDASIPVSSPQSIRIAGNSYSLNTLGQNWFAPILSISTYNCPINSCLSSSGGGDTKREADSTLYSIADSTYEAEEYPDATLWALQRNLYRSMQSDSTLQQDSLLAAFYANAANNSIGMYEELAEDRDNLDNLSIVDKNSLNTLYDYQSNLRDELENLELSLQDSTITELETDSLLTLVATKRNALHTVQQNIDAVLHTLDTLANIAADSLQARNLLLPAVEIFEQNERTINTIYLNRRNDFDFSEQEKADILAIASQCPLAGGKAVYFARILYALIDNTMRYDDEAMCTQAGIQYKHKQNANHTPKISTPSAELLVYPNPTSDVLTIQLLGINTGIAKLKVYDTYGREILSQLLDLENKTKEISVRGWHAGIYFMKVEAANGTYSTKVIVQ